MGKIGNLSTPIPLSNFPTTSDIKQETKKKEKKASKLVFKQQWPFFRVVRPKDRAANVTSCFPAASATSRNINPNGPSPSDHTENGVEDVAEKVSGRENDASSMQRKNLEDEDDETTKWVAFDDSCEEEEEEEDEAAARENKIDAAFDHAELEFASCYDDAASSFRRSSCCSDIMFKIDEEGGLVREEGESFVESDLTYHQPSLTYCSDNINKLHSPSTKLIKRLPAASGINPLSSFLAKTVRNVGYSQHFVSMLLWMNFKRRVLAVAAEQVRSKAGRMNGRMKKAVKGKISIARSGGGGAAAPSPKAKAKEELWERRIPMGRRCRASQLDDSPYGDDDDAK